MSEPIHIRKPENARDAARLANVSPFRIEMPPNPVGITLVPHHMASDPVHQGHDDAGKDLGEAAPLVRTGKIEVRFDGSTLPVKNDKAKSVDWHKVAYNAAHQAAYYRQVKDNSEARAEAAERALTVAEGDVRGEKQRRQEVEADKARLAPLVNAAYNLKKWWGYFLLPKTLKLMIGPSI